MEHTTIVETHSLTKRYGSGVLAVDSVDMSVRRGEVYGFLGPNGAGKTTTLRMLVGLIRPTSGTATVAGQAPGSPAGLARIGSLIESPGFYPYLSGRENLRVVADLAGAKQKRVDEVLDMVELTSRAGRKFGTYSTGMKQRLGVAGALLKDPDLLILDEPTNGLDPQGMAEMRKLIKDIGQGDRTVLLSSHLLGEVEAICDRVGVISNGHLVTQSTVQELLGEEGVLVRAQPIEQAQDVLTRMFGADAISRKDGAIHLKTKPENSVEINRQLVGAGIGVSELRPFERSLEEVFFLWMSIMAAVLFVAGAAMSVVVALFQGAAISWPAAVDIAKGFGALWLIFVAEGAIGLGLGVLIRQSAAALGAGLIYLLAVEIIAVRFIDSINNGAYQWIGNLFVGQNAGALTQSFTSPAFGRSVAPAISAEHAVLVLAAYGVGLVIVAAGPLRLTGVT